MINVRRYGIFLSSKVSEALEELNTYEFRAGMDGIENRMTISKFTIFPPD
jgi:hypothetical protein